jgi:predicted Zn-dependent protease
MRFAISLCAAVCLATTGCASTDGALESVQGLVADFVLPPEQAAQLGDRTAREIEASQPAHASPTLERIGARLLAQVGDVPPAYRFTFREIEQPGTVNAFALPGGHIYVTRDLMRLAGNEAQIAAVVAHEIAHVTERHVAERLGTTYGVQALAGAALGENSGAVTQLASSVLQQGFLLKYSRDQELEADRVGLRYLTRAGYDPQAAVAIFRKLAADGGQGAPAFLSSHPTTDRRIEQLQQIIARGS